MTTIHLLDAVFAHDVGSVAGKPPSYFAWNRLEPKPQKVDGPVVFTDGYVSAEWADMIDAPLKIGWLREPQCLWPDNYSRALSSCWHFNFILTYHAPFLYNNLNFKFVPYGGIWLPRQTWGIKPKTKNISMLIGSKQSTEGHRLRHEIYRTIENTGFLQEVDFYGVYGTPVDYGWQTKYRVLADYRYSIVTETCLDANLFTEILLDCLAVGTTPIFWGCPNYRKFFGDGTAILPFASADDLVDMMDRGWFDESGYRDSLPDTYLAMQAAAAYEITEDWLWHTYFKEMV